MSLKLPTSNPLIIPAALDVPLYTQRVTLDGVDYTFRLNWNGREGRWYLDLGDVNQDWIVTGVKIVCNWPLFRRLSDARRPPGLFMVLDNSAMGGEPPTLPDLGRRCVMLYFPATDN